MKSSSPYDFIFQDGVTKESLDRACSYAMILMYRELELSIMNKFYHGVPKWLFNTPKGGILIKTDSL